MTSVIIAHMGYAESGFASFMTFRYTGENPPETGIDAVTDLAKAFLSKYLFDDSTPNNRFRADDFSYYIRSHNSWENDEIGDMLEGHGFWSEYNSFQDLLNFPRDQILEIPFYAERVLVKSLTGEELDEDNNPFHDLASKFKEEIQNFRKGFWTYDDSKTREELASFIERKYLIRES